MAQLLKRFTPVAFASTDEFIPMSVGKHEVVISSSDVKENKSGTGGYLQLNLVDKSDGSRMAYRLNLYHASEKTADIANQKLSELLHVMGLGSDGITDSAELHNIPFIVEIGMQKNSEEYTEVKRVFPVAAAPVAKLVAKPKPTDFVAPKQTTSKKTVWDSEDSGDTPDWAKAAS